MRNLHDASHFSLGFVDSPSDFFAKLLETDQENASGGKKVDATNHGTAVFHRLMPSQPD